MKTCSRMSPLSSNRGKPNGQLVRSDSNETIDSIMNYTNSMKTTRRTVTSTQLAETMATHLPDSGMFSFLFSLNIVCANVLMCYDERSW